MPGRDGELPAEAIDEVNFLTKSRNRARVVRWLSENEYLGRDELKRRSDVSRTTLQRNLKALEEHALVRRQNRRYALTVAGEAVSRELLSLVEVADVAERLGPFWECVPPEEFDLDPSLLADARLTVADRGNPYAPVNDHVRAMKAAESFRCLLPSVALQPMEIARHCVERGKDHEVVFGPDAASTVRTDPAYETPFGVLSSAANCTLLESEKEPPFYLGIADGTVQIGVEKEGNPHALVESETEKVYDWAEELFDGYRRRADPIGDGSTPVSIRAENPDR